MRLPSQSAHYLLICLTFLFCGHSITLNDTLIPYLQDQLLINYTVVMLIQMSFFMGYFVASPTTGLLVQRAGYLRALSAATASCTLGAAGIAISLKFGLWPGVLLGSLVLGAGVGAVQVCANPYALRLGDPDSGPARLSFAQGFTCVGMVLAPLLAAAYVRPNLVLHHYYAMMSVVWLGIVLFSHLLRNSGARSSAQGIKGDTLHSAVRKLFSDPCLLACCAGLFLYVGAEVSVGSFLVRFLQQPENGNLSLEVAVRYSAIYWGGLMVGRFLEIRWIRLYGAARMVLIHSTFALILMLGVLLGSGILACVSALLLGLANSILFPALFSLGMQRIPDANPVLAGLLCTAQFGGALFPVCQGLIADHFALQISFILPAIAYLGIFAISFSASTWTQKGEAQWNPA